MDERARSRLVQELQRWDNDLKPYRELWDTLWTAWAPSAPNREKDKNNPFISQVRDPFGFHAVETILPRVVGEEPGMAYKAVDSAEDEPIAAIMSGLTSWQMERMGFEDEIRPFIRQALVCGYTVGKVGWVKIEQDEEHEEEETNYHEELGTSLTVARPRTVRVVVRNAPFFEAVSLYDFVWPLTAKSIATAEAVWQRRFVTRRYLEDRSDVYKNLGKVEYNDAGRAADVRRHQYEQQGLSPSQALDQNEDDDVAEIWERWGPFDGNESLIVLANPLTGTGVEIREDETPFDHKRKPYVDFAPIGWPFQMHGVGIIQILYDQNEHLNTLLRQLSDARTFQLNPAWKSSGVPGNQLELFPGKIVRVDDVEDLEPLVMPNIDLSAGWKEADELKRWMQRNTGAFEYLAGSGSDQPQQTATGVATITNEGNKRIGEMVKVFAERTMKPFGWMLSMMNAQFIEDETAVDFSRDPNALAAWSKFREVEKNQNDPQDTPGLVTVNANMLVARGRLEPLPNVGQDKEVNDIQRRSDAVQFQQAMGPFLAVPNPVINVRALAHYVAKAFNVSKTDRDAILGPPDQPTQVDLMAAEAKLNPPAGSNGSSGPSGDNLPTGNVVGAPGAGGPSGPAGIG